MTWQYVQVNVEHFLACYLAICEKEIYSFAFYATFA